MLILFFSGFEFPPEMILREPVLLLEASLRMGSNQYSAQELKYFSTTEALRIFT